MMRCTGGQVPERAQRGLDPSQVAQGLFLPCVCRPESDMRVAPKPTPQWPGSTLPAPAQVAAPPMDPGLWAELDDGRLVRRVLDAFYRKVFADALLAPYFHNTNADHVAGKQYAFLYEAMTGADMHFGDNPLNAQHWMVISDALFDHRQRLMIETLEEHGLSDDQIRRWTAFEEPYRPDIVKAQTTHRTVDGQAEPRAEGFAEETLAVGSLCDHCGGEIAAGTTVLYHQRLGTISCLDCQQRPRG